MPTTTPTTTIRVTTTTRATLRELAQASGDSMQQVLEQALELYRRQQVLEQTNAAYAALRRPGDMGRGRGRTPRLGRYAKRRAGASLDGPATQRGMSRQEQVGDSHFEK